MGRAPCCDKANVKKGPWSPEEDAQLKAYIEQHGTGGLKRCGKSCRLRWLNYLRPNIKHGGFSVEEDDIICSLYATIGSRWSIIAAHLPGRTDNDLKNYWNTKLKKKLLEKLKNDQNRHLVAAKTKYAKVEDANKYVGTQPTAGTDQNMDMKDLYTNSCHGRVLQLFEHATCCEGSTNADRFHVNLQQVSDQEMLTPDHNFRKLIDRLEASVIDGSNSMNTIMQASSNNTCNCYDASQYSHSIIETARQFSYERAQAQAPSLECAEYLNNNVKSESPNIVGAPPPQTDNLIVFPATSSINCGSSEGNYQSAWMNTLNDEHKPNVNMGGYEFSMGLNDLLYCRNNSKCSLYPEQRQGNGGWCPFLGTMDISGLTSDIESYSGTCLNIYH